MSSQKQRKRALTNIIFDCPLQKILIKPEFKSSFTIYKQFLSDIWLSYNIYLKEFQLFIEEKAITDAPKSIYTSKNPGGPKKFFKLPENMARTDIYDICFDFYCYVVYWRYKNNNTLGNTQHNKINEDIIRSRLKIIQELSKRLSKIKSEIKGTKIFNGLNIYKNVENKRLIKQVTISGKSTILDCDTYHEKWTEIFDSTSLTWIKIKGKKYLVPSGIKNMGWILHMEKVIWEQNNPKRMHTLQIIWVDQSTTKIDFAYLSNLTLQNFTTIIQICWDNITHNVNLMRTRFEIN
jgi:hypothetical protein